MPHGNGNAGTTAKELIDELAGLRARDAAEGRGNALLAVARDGGLTTDHLRRVVAVEAQCHRAETAAYGLMTARFPRRPAVSLYTALTTLVHDAQPKLTACAEALGMSEDDLWFRPRTYETYAFNGMLSWIALEGSQAATALAAHTDMTVYFADCAELVRMVREHQVPAPDEFLAYYEGGISQELLDLAAEAVDDGLRRGDDPAVTLLMARHLERSIGDFWTAAAAGGHPGESGTGFAGQAG
jgi:hypothetical protein